MISNYNLTYSNYFLTYYYFIIIFIHLKNSLYILLTLVERHSLSLNIYLIHYITLMIFYSVRKSHSGSLVIICLSEVEHLIIHVPHYFIFICCYCSNLLTICWFSKSYEFMISHLFPYNNSQSNLYHKIPLSFIQ